METPPGSFIKRHRLATRLWHWMNAVAIVVLIGSGLMILNAHPHLYWGASGANFDRPWLSTPRMPGWITIPASYNLAIARRWHLLFAPVLAFGLLAYMIASIANGHFAQVLRVRLAELSPGMLWHDLREHWALRFHDPADPRAYNIFQKLSYVLVLFVLIPLMIATGLAMSPNMDAAWPWLLDVLGGRQSARSLHFLCAFGLIGFTIVHLALVILAGSFNEVRSIVSGWWRVPE